MNNKVLAIVGVGCLLVLLCGACVVGVYFFGGSQLNQLASQLGIPSSQGGSGLAPEAPGSRAPGALPKPTAGAANQPPGQLPGSDLFASALNKAKTAQKYRVEFAMLFGSTQNGKYSEEPFVDFTGEVDSGNSHFVSKGGLFSLLAGGGTLEIIEADGKNYMKGISMGLGITDPKVWYVQKDTSSMSGFEDFTKPDYFSGFTGGTKPSDFKKVRTEPLDGQSCDVYNYDFKSVQNAAIVGLMGSAKDKQDFSTIDKAEINVWLCGDGFVHKYTMEYSGHDQKNPNEKGAMKMNSHLWDFNNASIKVTAPAGAKPMPGQ